MPVLVPTQVERLREKIRKKESREIAQYEQIKEIKESFPKIGHLFSDNAIVTRLGEETTISYDEIRKLCLTHNLFFSHTLKDLPSFPDTVINDLAYFAEEVKTLKSYKTYYVGPFKLKTTKDFNKGFMVLYLKENCSDEFHVISKFKTDHWSILDALIRKLNPE